MAAINGLTQKYISELTANQLGGLGASSGAKEAGGENGAVSFADVLNQAVQNQETLNAQSDVGTLNLLSGNTDDLAGLMIDSKKSEIGVNLTVAIRNKAMDAYKEVMNMQV